MVHRYDPSFDSGEYATHRFERHPIVPPREADWRSRFLGVVIVVIVVALLVALGLGLLALAVVRGAGHA